ncbi:MAG: hypothetical protein AB7P04_01115 [Bacteriovoracia bacterium]
MPWRPSKKSGRRFGLAIAFGWALLVVRPAPGTDGDINTFIKWKECQSNGDCALVRGVCGAVDAVNGAMVKRYRAYVKRVSQVASCTANPPTKLADFRARCVETRCQAVH